MINPVPRRTLAGSAHESCGHAWRVVAVDVASAASTREEVIELGRMRSWFARLREQQRTRAKVLIPVRANVAHL